MRYTKSQVRNIAENLISIIGTNTWNHVEMGNSSYGRTYKLAWRDPETGALSHVFHIGMTTREAVLSLNAMRELAYRMREEGK